ncbi:MAG TPA: flagellar motor protein MotB, partial [Terriglobales bacterium]|nr:flagellar motor protein MotB [Terriglobales bacterium]
MKNNPARLTALALAAIVTLGACHKKQPIAPATPPPPPPTPTAQLSVTPSTINAGQTATLTWSSENAVSVSIDPIGKVDLSGQRTVTPTESTTYHLTATGPGGTAEQTARVTVNQPPPPPQPTQTAPPETMVDSFNNTIRDKGDVYFDYDSF